MRTEFKNGWFEGVLPECGGVDPAAWKAMAGTHDEAFLTKWASPDKRWRTQRQIEILMPELLNGRQGRVLDIGCGTGGHLATCRYLGHEVAGTERAGSKYEPLSHGLGLDVRRFTIGVDTRLPFDDGEFDVAMCLSVLIRKLIHHLIPAVLSEMARVIRPGGLIVVGWWKPEAEGGPKWSDEYIPAGWRMESAYLNGHFKRLLSPDSHATPRQ